MSRKGYYQNEDKMFNPLNVESTDVKRRSYWDSDKNGFILVGLIIAYIVIMMFMLKMLSAAGVSFKTQLLLGIGITLFYLLVPTQLAVRKFIIQENRLREVMRTLEMNRKSGIGLFSGIDTIGYKGENSNGLIKYDRDIFGYKRGVIVGFDKSSIIDIPEGFYTNYRETIAEFYRATHNLGMDVYKIELRRRPYISEQLRYERTLIRKVTEEDPVRATFHGMQLQAKIAQELGMDTRYMEYYMVTKKDYKIAIKMKELVDKVISETLGTNGYIVDPHILTFREIEDLVNDYYLVDGINIGTIKKTVEAEDFGEMVEITGIFEEGNRRISDERFKEVVEDFEEESQLEADVSKEEEAASKLEETQRRLFNNYTDELLGDYNAGRINATEYGEFVKRVESEYLQGELLDVKYKVKLTQLREAYAKENKKEETLKKERELEEKRLAEKARKEEKRKKEEVIVVDLGEGEKPSDEKLFKIFDEEE